MLTFIRKHSIAVGAAAVAVTVAVAWLAFGYFGVHTLFVDDEVDEAVPVFDSGATPAVLAADVVTPAPTPTPTPTPERSDDPPPAEPVASATADAPTDSVAEVQTPPEPRVEFVGTFESDAHPTAGTATVLGDGSGQRFLRFEGFETDNGPDLNVYLVNSSTGDVSDYVDLGDLKGNIGDQNYEIPEGFDLTVYDEVVIWCVRFGVGFGDAVLVPA